MSRSINSTYLCCCPPRFLCHRTPLIFLLSKLILSGRSRYRITGLLGQLQVWLSIRRITFGSFIVPPRFNLMKYARPTAERRRFLNSIDSEPLCLHGAAPAKDMNGHNWSTAYMWIRRTTSGLPGRGRRTIRFLNSLTTENSSCKLATADETAEAMTQRISAVRPLWSSMKRRTVSSDWREANLHMPDGTGLR